MKRFLLLLAGTVIGVLAGAWYGWSVSPVTYNEISPDQLRAEFQADYVLMAAVRLSRLGQPDLAGLVRRIADAYQSAGFPEEDCARLYDLARDLDRYSTLPTAQP
jgi:hypothetical protein